MAATRLLFVDGIRGTAALSVALFHIGRDFLELDFLFLLAHGVTVFFVLSGFVISHSLLDKRITGRFFALFALRRSVRLDPAYWTAIVLAIGFMWIPNLFFDHQHPLPSPTEFTLHLFYLQDLSGIDSINVVFWTLCYEMQFYVVFCGIMYVLNKFTSYALAMGHLVTIFSVLLMFSLLWPSGIYTASINGLFIDLWYLFLLGAFARWALFSDYARHILLIAVLLLLLSLWAFNSHDLTPVVGSVTALALMFALRLDKMGQWLNWRWLQYLGAISYSLYLLHDIVGLYVRDTGLHLTAKYLGLSSLAINYLWCSVALAFSVLAAHILFKTIERPSHKLSRKIVL